MSVPTINGLLYSTGVKINVNGGAFYFNDDFSALAVAANDADYSDSANAGDLVLRAKAGKRLLLLSGSSTANMIMESNNNITYNSPTVYYNGNIAITGSGYMTGGTNIPKRIYYGGTPLTPYVFGSFYMFDIYPANVMTNGAGSIRYFNISFYSTTINITAANYPYGSYDIMVDSSNNTYLAKPIYLGSNTAISFTNYAISGYFSIYYSTTAGSTLMAVNIFQKNYY